MLGRRRFSWTRIKGESDVEGGRGHSLGVLDRESLNLEDGATVELENLASGTWGFRADAAQDAEIGSVRLELSGAKTVSRTENGAPWSLYGEPDGAGLPAGDYVLRATVYAERNLSEDVLQTLAVAFAVAAAAEMPALSVADVEATSGTLSFEVTLSPAANAAVTVDYATADGTARRRAGGVGRGDGAVGRRAGADAGGAPGRGVLRAGHRRVAELQPDAVDAAVLCGAGGPVVGWAGDERGRGAVGPGDDGGHGARRPRVGQPP